MAASGLLLLASFSWTPRFHQSSDAFLRAGGRVPFRNLLSFPYLGFSAISPRHESLDTVQVRPTWQEAERQRKAEFISCSCESYISTIPLCAVWQQRNDGCHLSYGLKGAVGKGI